MAHSGQIDWSESLLIRHSKALSAIQVQELQPSKGSDDAHSLSVCMLCSPGMSKMLDQTKGNRKEGTTSNKSSKQAVLK